MLNSYGPVIVFLNADEKSFAGYKSGIFNKKLGKDVGCKGTPKTGMNKIIIIY
jgi:hypothetical protein